MTLPQVVLDEIFDLRYKISEQAVEHLADQLDEFECVVVGYVDYDMSMVIAFKRRDPPAEGELRIDRTQGDFEISIKRGDEMFLPRRGSWAMVIEYLIKVLG